MRFFLKFYELNKWIKKLQYELVILQTTWLTLGYDGCETHQKKHKKFPFHFCSTLSTATQLFFSCFQKPVPTGVSLSVQCLAPLSTLVTWAA